MVDDSFSLEFFRHYRICILCHNVNRVAICVRGLLSLEIITIVAVREL